MTDQMESKESRAIKHFSTDFLMEIHNKKIL